MRILQINKTFKSFGGIETHIDGLLKQLKKNGHVIATYSPRKIEGFFSVFSRFFSIKAIIDVNKRIKTFKPDIIHLHEVSLNMSPSFLLLAKKYNIPFMMTAHHYGYICPKQWMIYEDGEPCRYGISHRCIYKNCRTKKQGQHYFLYNALRWLKMMIHKSIYQRYLSHIICPSKALASEFKKHYDIDPKKISTIYNFTDLETTKLSKDHKVNNKLLFVGRLSKEKGCANLVRAIALVKEKHPDVKLKIIGDGPEKNNINRLIAENNLTDNIKLVGKVDHNKLVDYYLDSDVLVVSSVSMESFGLVVLEGFYNNLPVIGSNRGALPELIDDQKTGLIFNTNDVSDLASKIITLIKNPLLIKNMRNRIADHIKKFPTSEEYLSEIESLYKDLIVGADRL